MLIPDPDLVFLPIPDQGVKNAPDPQHRYTSRVLLVILVAPLAATESLWVRIYLKSINGQEIMADL
jgi:hypothetical protein